MREWRQRRARPSPERPMAARRQALAAALLEHRMGARYRSLVRQALGWASALTQMMFQLADQWKAQGRTSVPSAPVREEWAWVRLTDIRPVSSTFLAPVQSPFPWRRV